MFWMSLNHTEKQKKEVNSDKVVFKWMSMLHFVLLLKNVVAYSPAVVQEKVLAELQEGPPLSPHGTGRRLGLGFDLGPWVPLSRLEAPGVLDFRDPGERKVRLSLLGVNQWSEAFVEKKQMVGYLLSLCWGQGKSCSGPGDQEWWWG